MKKYALEAMLESLLIREGKPASHAVEAKYYGNPADHVKFDREKGSDMRRVRKEEVHIDIVQKPDPLDYCLECFKVYISENDRERVKAASGLMGDSDGYGEDPHDAQRKKDLRIGAAVSAEIHDPKFSFLNRWAIYTLCSVATTFKYPNADILLVGPVARYLLGERLKKNMVTSILF